MIKPAFLSLMLLPMAALADPVPVTTDNFIRAESDLFIGNAAKLGGVGKWHHTREPSPLDNQTVIRLNRDTLYSSLVLDLDAGPARLTVPDAGERFISAQVVNEDHYVPFVWYEPGTYDLTQQNVGTRYAVLAVRTLVNPNDPEDLEAVHALQDQLQVEQAAPGAFTVPEWDPESQGQVRQHLNALAAMLPDTRGMFGTKDQVDPVRHLLGSAYAWGGNPEKDALYLNFVPERNDGQTVYKLLVRDVPVDGFWSVSVYDKNGYYQPNDLNAYSFNNVTAKKADDGSVAIQFGGCAADIPNCLPITEGWNYMVRLYRPQAAILDGSWTFPMAEVTK